MQTDAGKTIRLQAVSNRRSMQHEFIRKFAHHEDADISLK